MTESNKDLYPEHLALSEIQRGLKCGRYVQGSFQASRENYLEASVNVHDSDEPVCCFNHLHHLQFKFSSLVLWNKKICLLEHPLVRHVMYALYVILMIEVVLLNGRTIVHSY